MTSDRPKIDTTFTALQMKSNLQWIEFNRASSRQTSPVQKTKLLAPHNRGRCCQSPRIDRSGHKAARQHRETSVMSHDVDYSNQRAAAAASANGHYTSQTTDETSYTKVENVHQYPRVNSVRLMTTNETRRSLSQDDYYLGPSCADVG